MVYSPRSASGNPNFHKFVSQKPQTLPKIRSVSTYFKEIFQWKFELIICHNFKVKEAKLFKALF